MTLPQMLRWHAKHSPASTALRHKSLGIWQGISWQEYHRNASLVALGLHALGLRRGDRIAIAAEGVPQWFFSDLGAEMIGVQVVGIYPTNPWNELQYIVRHCQASVVVCGDQEQTDKVLDALRLEGGLPHVKHVICIDTKGMRHYDKQVVRSFDDLLDIGLTALEQHPSRIAWLDAQIDAASIDDVNVLIYTSGTTGAPKGAMLTHRNLTFANASFAEASGLKPGQYEAVCYLPLCHVAERSYSMVLHLVLGGVVNFAESVDTVAANIREIAPTFFLGVPRIWEKLQQNLSFRALEAGNPWRSVFALALRRGRTLAHRRAARDGRRTLLELIEYGFWYGLLFRNMQRAMGLDRTIVRVCGGASVSPETLLFFDILGLPICQGYGLTESCGMAFVQRPERGSRVGTCGPPLDGVELRLAGDGEIMLRSQGVFKGYLDDPAASLATLGADGWLATGDIGKLDERGELMIVDRKKAIIITSGGKNIAPSEIENALRDSPYIQEAIVVGEGRNYLGGLIQIDFETVGRWASERDISYSTYRSLAVHDAVKALLQEVVNEVNRRFARVENIRRFVILEKELDHDDGELTATQKIRRSVIEKKFARELALIYDAKE
ncbi:AMP-binding protein [Comamonadaceae bacterium G21597-S1]|nr:AMP-binding protein [Comamonadaceae bacterium G21597-S1]